MPLVIVGGALDGGAAVIEVDEGLLPHGGGVVEVVEADVGALKVAGGVAFDGEDGALDFLQGGDLGIAELGAGDDEEVNVAIGIEVAGGEGADEVSADEVLVQDVADGGDEGRQDVAEFGVGLQGDSGVGEGGGGDAKDGGAGDGGGGGGDGAAGYGGGIILPLHTSPFLTQMRVVGVSPAPGALCRGQRGPRGESRCSRGQGRGGRSAYPGRR